MEEITNKEYLNLYKAHFTAVEVAKMSNQGYQKIAALYRAYRNLGIAKFDRLNLIPEEDINDKVQTETQSS